MPIHLYRNAWSNRFYYFLNPQSFASLSEWLNRTENLIDFRKRLSSGTAENAVEETVGDEKKDSEKGAEKRPAATRPGFRVDLSSVKEDDPYENQDDEETPSKNRQRSVQWWKPDPITGVWIPNNHRGSINSAQLRQDRMRNWPRASLDERAWWSSLEELPDDRRSTPSMRRIKDKEKVAKAASNFAAPEEDAEGAEENVEEGAEGAEEEVGEGFSRKEK